MKPLQSAHSCKFRHGNTIAYANICAIAYKYVQITPSGNWIEEHIYMQI